MLKKLKKEHLFPLVQLIFSCISLILISAYFLLIGVWSIGSWQNFTQFFFILLFPLGLFIIFLREFILSWKALKHKKNRAWTLHSILFLVTFYIGVILTFAFFFLFFLSDNNPPKLFPLDDPRARYTVVNEQGTYMIQYKSTSDKNAFYTCSWEKNGNTECKTEISNDVTAVIGQSPYDLNDYVGKNVIISGEFVYGKKQCIETVCKELGNYVLLNIFSIREK